MLPGESARRGRYGPHRSTLSCIQPTHHAAAQARVTVMAITLDKKADLAGPGIGTYEEVAQVLPSGYQALLGPKETQRAVHAAKRYIEDNLCTALNLFHVEVPLIVTKESGVNDYLDRDG